MNALFAIARQFAPANSITAIDPLGNGLINDTYLVSGAAQPWVLQKINPHVFPQAELIMDNLQHLSHHLRQKSAQEVRLHIPLLIPTLQQQSFFLDSQHACWRALSYIPHSFSQETLSSLTEAKQVGWALGHFHRLCSDLATEALHDTLPGFHITPQYFTAYQAALQANTIPRDADFSYCTEVIAAHNEFLSVLEQAKHQGTLKLRVTHGDPKLNNFLFSSQTQQIISLIDLDTVKPGLIHYDIGDCLRSCCQDKHSGEFDVSMCRAILQAYLQETHTFLTAADYDFLYPAIRLIPFELGLRFFTDYLSGNRYFKVQEPLQNLQRAVQQFKLSASIQRQQAAITAMIAQLRH